MIHNNFLTLTHRCHGHGRYLLRVHFEPPTSLKMISLEEIARHNTPDDLWVAVNGRVFDVTNFADLHPGKAAVKRLVC